MRLRNGKPSSRAARLIRGGRSTLATVATRSLSTERVLLLFTSKPSRICERGAEILGLQRRVLTQDLCLRLTGRQIVENDRYHDPSALDARLSMADVRVNRDSVPPILRCPGSGRFLGHGFSPPPFLRPDKSCGPSYRRSPLDEGH